MIEAQNVEILREAYRHWVESKTESVDHWMDLFAEEFHFHSMAEGAAGLEFTGPCHCKQDLARYFEELSKQWESVYYRVDEFIAQNDRIVVIGSCSWKNKKTGKVIETPKVDIVRMKNGKIVDFWEIYDTAKSLAGTV